MLDVAQVHQLMFQLRHLVARESTLRILKIELVNRSVDHLIAELPVFEHLRLRVGLWDQRQRAVWVGRTGDAILILHLALLMYPGAKRLFTRLEICMCEEQGVICDLPKRILMVGREPNVVGAALDGFAEHGEASVILAPGSPMIEAPVSTLNVGAATKLPTESGCELTAKLKSTGLRK